MNTPIDMSQFVQAKSDQLNADDLIGGPRTIRVRGVRANEGAPEQPVSIFYEGDDDKPYKPCKSMRRLLIAVWGNDASKYVGRSMTVYRDPKVKFGGMAVGGIRISHASHIDGQMTVALMETKGKRAPHVVKPLQADAPRQQQAAADGGGDEPSPLDLQNELRDAKTIDELGAVWTADKWKRARKVWSEATVTAVTKVKDDRKAELTAPAAAEKAVSDEDVPF